MSSAPGWYPDPDGKGGQRYFDGLNWGPQAPAATAPPPPPPPQKKPGGCLKTVLGLVCIIFVIGIIGNACGSDDDKSSSSSSSSSRSSAASASPRTSATPTTTEAPKPPANYTTGADGSVVAAFAIHDNFTEGMIKSGARYDTIDILKYAKLNYPSAPQVEVKGSFPMKDAYGNTSTDTVIDLVYLKSTIDQINFDGVDKDKIWEIADSGVVYPAFRP